MKNEKIKQIAACVIVLLRICRHHGNNSKVYVYEAFAVGFKDKCICIENGRVNIVLKEKVTQANLYLYNVLASLCFEVKITSLTL